MKRKTLRSIFCLGLVLAMLAGCGAKQPPAAETPNTTPEESQNAGPKVMEADVIVVGGGLSGLNAAVFAAENGASVIVIEKLGFVGGSGLLSSGGMFTAESGGINTTRDDSLEEALNFWNLETPHGGDSGYPDQDRLTYMLGQTGTTVQKLVSMGLETDAVYNFNIMSKGGGAGLIGYLSNMADERGVTTLVNCKGEELIQENGKVVGVKATDSDGEVELRGKIVILACGGFGSNEELIAQWTPQCSVMQTWRVCVGDEGDGILMALDAGAVMYENPWLLSSGTFVSQDYVRQGGSALVLGNSLLVNDEGERFANEAPSSFSAITSKMVELGYDHAWALMAATDDNREALEKGIELGEVVKGTLAEVAEQLHMDADTLQMTFDKYAAACENGTDEEFGKAEGSLLPLNGDEVYAVKYYPTCIGSMSGVKTNYDCQVLREDGSVIEGLMAVGEMSNRAFFNYNYVGGGSVGLDSTMGRLAGEKAAELVKE